MSVRLSVRPSTKSFFDFNDIWYVGRGQWVMTVCRMTRCKVKVKVTSPWKSEIRPFSKVISSPMYNVGWQMTNYGTIPKAYRGLIFRFYSRFCVTWLSSWQYVRVDRQSRMGLIYCIIICILKRSLVTFCTSVHKFLKKFGYVVIQVFEIMRADTLRQTDTHTDTVIALLRMHPLPMPK